MKRREWRGFSRTVLAALVVAASVAAAGPAMAQMRGTCLSVDVPGSLLLPDGTDRNAALLTICMHQRMSPVAVLHRLYVDRVPVGIFVSRSSQSEAFADPDPFVLFERQGSGEYRLLGYVWPGHAHASAHRLAWPERRSSGGDVVASAGNAPLSEPWAEWVRARAE